MNELEIWNIGYAIFAGLITGFSVFRRGRESTRSVGVAVETELVKKLSDQERDYVKPHVTRLAYSVGKLTQTLATEGFTTEELKLLGDLADTIVGFTERVEACRAKNLPLPPLHLGK